MNAATLFVDGRETLPRHPTRRFKRRVVAQLAGLVTHHTASTGSPEAVANYHSKPNHVCPEGCPGTLYTFLIHMNVEEGRAEVWWANDLDRQTFSQGGGTGSPIEGLSANANFLGICMVGNFYSKGNKSGTRPHIMQVAAWFSLIGHLLGTMPAGGFPDELFGALSHLSWSDQWGHLDFGKAACPGDDMAFLVDLAQESEGSGVALPESAREWQRCLSNAGYDLGKWGPGKDGVDGDWGQTSRLRLVQFQRANELPPTGERDMASACALAPFLGA